MTGSCCRAMLGWPCLTSPLLSGSANAGPAGELHYGPEWRGKQQQVSRLQQGEAGEEEHGGLADRAGLRGGGCLSGDGEEDENHEAQSTGCFPPCPAPRHLVTFQGKRCITEL